MLFSFVISKIIFAVITDVIFIVIFILISDTILIAIFIVILIAILMVISALSPEDPQCRWRTWIAPPKAASPSAPNQLSAQLAE